jgi:hypothetical protein
LSGSAQHQTPAWSPFPWPAPRDGEARPPTCRRWADRWLNGPICRSSGHRVHRAGRGWRSGRAIAGQDSIGGLLGGDSRNELALVADDEPVDRRQFGDVISLPRFARLPAVDRSPGRSRAHQREAPTATSWLSTESMPPTHSSEPLISISFGKQRPDRRQDLCGMPAASRRASSVARITQEVTSKPSTEHETGPTFLVLHPGQGTRFSVVSAADGLFAPAIVGIEPVASSVSG